MVLPVNTQTAGEALSLASEASLRGSQSLAMSLESKQKSREMQEWSSEEQKKMRQAKTKAETAAAEKQFNLDTLEGDFITKNPELYQEAMKSGIMAEAAKKWQEMDAAESEMFGKLYANIDAEDPEQVRAAVTNGLKNPATRAMTSRLPSANALLKGDPAAIAQLKVLQGSWFMNAKHQQALALGKVEQGYTQENMKLQGGIQMGLQTQNQGFTLNRDAIQHGYDLEKLKASSGYEYAIQTAKAKGSGKPLKVEDVIPGGIAAFTTNTTGPAIAGLLDSMDIDLSDEQTMQLVSDVSSLALDEWQKLQRMYEANEISAAPDQPGVLAQRIALSKLSNNIDSSGWGNDTYLTDEQATALKAERDKEQLQTDIFMASKDPRYQKTKEILSKSPDFTKLSEQEQHQRVKEEILKRTSK